jgi:DNA-binding PadR family transcriptional regulator
VQPGWSRPSFPEWVVLCVVNEKPSPAFAIADLLARDGSLGRTRHIPKPVVYRATSRLVQLGLVTARSQQDSTLGPARLQLAATRKGDQAARGWLHQPVAHPLDPDSELMIKLALLSRAGTDPTDLLLAQRAQLAPLADAAEAQLRAVTGSDYTMAVWRHESVSGVLRFIDAMLAAVPA